jgi:hypothetical protein
LQARLARSLSFIVEKRMKQYYAQSQKKSKEKFGIMGSRAGKNSPAEGCLPGC